MGGFLGLARTPIDTSMHLSKNRGGGVAKLEYSRIIGTLMYLMTGTSLCEMVAVVDYGLHYDRYHARVIERFQYNAKLDLNIKILDSTSGYEKFMAFQIPFAEKRQNDYVNLAHSTMYNRKSRHICHRHNSIRQLLSMGVISIYYVKSKDNIVDPLTKGLSIELVRVDLLKENRTTNLYTINLHEMASASSICPIARATSTESWLMSINGDYPISIVGSLLSKRMNHEDLGKLGAKGLDLTYALSTITSQKPTESDLDLLFEAMYDDYIGGQPLTALRTTPAALAYQVIQTPMASTTTADNAPTPTNSSSQIANIPNTSQDVDELEPQ
ncbi:hypothetical protein Tco_1227447 [Tanacetum coccineum]